MTGQALATLGLAICAGLCGVGSSVGLYYTGSAAAGVLAEDSKKFSKVLILVVLPATQGIYGFVFAIIGMGSVPAIAAMEAAVGGIHAIAKNEALSGKLILFPAMVETYAILGLVVSILLM